MFDFGRVDNDYFIAMDYVRGADLASLFAAERAAGRRLAPPLLAHVGVEICRGLAYVHARGFVHRDVTPRNVLVSVDGEVKLSDFGLALALQSPIAPGRPGTPSYMAPEQARGDRVDARADIYSLGLILAEGLLGRGPRANRDRAGGVDASLLADLATHGDAEPDPGPRHRRRRPASASRAPRRCSRRSRQEIARTGAAREALVRELAAKVRLLAPGRRTLPRRAGAARGHRSRPPSTTRGRRARATSAITARQRSSTACSRRSRHRRRRGRACAVRIAALAAGAALDRGRRVRDAGRGAGRGGAIARRGAPRRPPAPDARGSARAAARLRRSRPGSRRRLRHRAPPCRPRARRAPQSRAPAAAPTSRIRILCTPWCVPFVDGKARGPDGRSFVVPVPAGRHRVEARRLDDRLQRQLDVAPGQEASTQFDFDEAPR